MEDKEKAHANQRNLKRYKEDLTSTGKPKLKAVAIQYDVDKERAPKIVAMGRGSVAEMILDIAEDNRIPFYEDPILTDLLSKLEVSAEIPGELYTLVAEVLAFVYQLDKLAKKRQQVRKKYAKKKKNS